ncbi:MAG: cyclic nucleotide-binding domain-containing protein [Eubacterium sp.]|nr:cyclic nucleotide-binding domain-containing protein [Eubacterium sp.]
MKELYFGKGEIVFNEGDEGNSFFQVLNGKAGVYVNYKKENEIKLTDVVAGQYFGELAVIESTPRSTTVVSESGVNVIEISGTSLSEYFSEQPDKIIAIINNIGGRIRELSNEYSEAKNVLKSIEENSADKSNESFIKKIQKYINHYKASVNLYKPSVEATRDDNSIFDEKDCNNMEVYSKNTIIFKQGEAGNCMYLVYGGRVSIYSDYGTVNQQKLTDLVSGEFFGEMGMLSQEVRSATAVADEDGTYVEIISEDGLEDLFKTNPGEVDNILRHISRRLRKLTDSYFNVCKKIYENS